VCRWRETVEERRRDSVIARGPDWKGDTENMADPKQVYRARPSPDEIAEVLAKRLVATVGTLN
jgi:hypothetical protein